jgi:hypothetical protein
MFTLTRKKAAEISAFAELSANPMRAGFEQLPIKLYPIDQPLVRAAAETKGEHALSYADTFWHRHHPAAQRRSFNNGPEFDSVKSLIKNPLANKIVTSKLTDGAVRTNRFERAALC